MLKSAQWACGLLISAAVIPAIALSQQDPGVRGGAINGQPGATATGPAPLSSVSSNNPSGVLEFFQNGLTRFRADESLNSTANKGLGPRFNLNSCAGCHAQPTVGGSGPGTNPESQLIGMGMVDGGTNTVPSFVTAHGPTRVARFPFFTNSNGSPDTSSPNGGVEPIFTVTGLRGAGHCNLSQPNFAQAIASNNIIFRIPTPTFGLGLIENIDDSTLVSVQQSVAGNAVGISGTFNRNGNDGTISRFGWKAQNKSLLLFAGEAYNVEEGITNELFPQERPLPEEEQSGNGLPANCLNLGGAGYPEDATNFAVASDADSSAQNAQVPADIVLFAEFMRLLAPPTPSANVLGGVSEVHAGSELFEDIGCSMCHTPTINSTQASNVTPALSNKSVNAFSDFEIHHMGSALADNVSQGGAGGDQFRSAPLWGIGQRIYFLHDGRTTDLAAAIQAHKSSGSEATQVVQNFDSLTASQQQSILTFLRSL